MTRRVWVVWVGLSLLAITPMFGGDATKPVQLTSTERVDFAPGGAIRVNDSYADLNIEAWDRPEVEITVTKSVWRSSGPNQDREAARRMERVRVVTERKSGTELAISTLLPVRGGLFSHRSSGGVTIEYEIHAPRDSNLIIHHGTGSVFVNGVAGDIDASVARGDIVLMLPDSGTYSIDAKTKLGNVTSGFEGSVHSRHVVGQGFARTSSDPSRKLHLRMGFGGIAIKAVPPEADALAASK